MMLVRKLDIWRLKLAFQLPVKHNLKTHTGSENIVVKVTTAGGLSGYGEGIPRDFVTGETMAESLKFLEGTLAPAFMNRSFETPQALKAALAESWLDPKAAACPGAFCALECALLDAGGKTWNLPVADIIGPRLKDRVVYSAVLPMASPAQMGRLLKVVKDAGMRFLKLKVGDAGDLEMLEMARQALGWEIDLRVDANAAWSAAEAVERIREMARFRISSVEQPVAKDDFLGMKQVREGVEVPISADESLCTEADARRLIDLKACQIFNIRLSKCGGLGASARILKLAQEAGVRCQLGCHVGETSILSAAGRAFALCAGDLAYIEGSISPYLLTRDPVENPVLFEGGGLAYALPGPGLGVQPQDNVLCELAVSHFSGSMPRTEGARPAEAVPA